MLSKLLVILVCILAVSSEARLHGRRRLSRSGHKIRRLMNSPGCGAILMDGCQHQCAIFGGNSQECTTCVTNNMQIKYGELVKQGCVEPPKMDKCSAIMMDGCLGLCTRGNTPECNECATRNAMNNQAELMENGCINRNRRLFRTAVEAPQICCQSKSWNCVACRKRQERNAWYKRRQEIKNLVRSMMNDPDWAPALEGKDNRRLNGAPTSWQQAREFQSWNNHQNNHHHFGGWDEAEENAGGGRVYGEYEKGPYKAGAEYNWDEEEENVGGRGYGKPQFREYFEAGGWRL